MQTVNFLCEVLSIPAKYSSHTFHLEMHSHHGYLLFGIIITCICWLLNQVIDFQNKLYTEGYSTESNNTELFSISTFCTQLQQLLPPARGCVVGPERLQTPGACLPHHAAGEETIFTYSYSNFPRVQERGSKVIFKPHLAKNTWHENCNVVSSRVIGHT